MHKSGVVRLIISTAETFANPAKARIPPAIGEAARPKQEAISMGKTNVMGVIPSLVVISDANRPKALNATIPLPIIIVAKYTKKLSKAIVNNTASAANSPDLPNKETALAKIPTPPSALIPSANTLTAIIMLTTETKSLP